MTLSAFLGRDWPNAIEPHEALPATSSYQSIKSEYLTMAWEGKDLRKKPLRRGKLPKMDGVGMTWMFFVVVFLMIPILTLAFLSGAGIVKNPQDWKNSGIWVDKS